MNAVEKRILKNQSEIMRTLHYILKFTAPDLIGKAGEMDKFRDDLQIASMETEKLINSG